MIVVGAVTVSGTIIALLDMTIVNVAIHSIGRDLGGSISSVQWVLTGYMLAFAGIIPATGWAIDRFGAKRVWIGALSLFMVGSAMSGFAWSIGALIAFRVMAGLGGGMIPPLGEAILAQAAGPWRLGRVMGTLAIPSFLGSISGPVLGGIIVSSAGWRWIFFIEVPLCIMAVLAAMRLLPRTSSRLGSRLDLGGLVLLSFGVTIFIYGMSEIGSGGGFTGVRGLIGLCTGFVLLALYGVHARAKRGLALIDLSLFKERAFAAAAAAILLISISMFGALLLFPLYWQIVRGESPFVTGLLLAPQAVGAMVALPLAGRVTDAVGAGFVVPVGIILALAGTAAYTQVGVDTSHAVLVGALFVMGLGAGAIHTPLTVSAFVALPREAVPRAASALHVIKRLGASVGTAVLAIVLQRAIVGEVPQLGDTALGPLTPEVRARIAPDLADAFKVSFWVAFGLTAIALGPALMLPRARRRVTQRRKQSRVK
jgi:EmrB/QacA subfamily drug resistance transporter